MSSKENTDPENDRFEQIKELTLLLMYLTSWEECPLPRARIKELTEEELSQFSTRLCWKGYDFDALDALDALSDDGMIAGKGKNKSAVIYDKGEESAKALMAKYNIK